ncbi:MAG: hypothetical protein ACOX8R_02500 [Bacillota bacterium]|jgi:hypothetical protein
MNLYVDEELATVIFSGLCAVVAQQRIETQVKIVECQHDLIHGISAERAAAMAPAVQPEDPLPADPEEATEVEKEKENVQL